MSWDERARLWGRHPTHLRRLERARAAVRRALAEHPTAYVAWSAGKDSGAVLQLAREVRPDIEARILTWPETRLLGDYDRVIADWRARGATIVEVGLTRSSVDERVAGRWSALQGDSAAYLCGLRRDESRTRRIALSMFGDRDGVYRTAGGIVRAAPIQHWTTLDVAAFVQAHAVPVLSVYTDTAEGFDRRTSTRVPRPSVRDAMLADLRERNPAAYAALSALYGLGSQ